MSEVRTTHVPSPVDSLAMVSADQSTVLGNGTSADPLRAVATEIADLTFFAFPTVAIPGLFVAISDDRTVRSALATTAGNPFAAAIVESVDGDQVRIKTRGVVELTESEWDLVTGGSGGLTPDAGYVLSATTPGHITKIPPSASDTYVVPAGVALTSTKMLLATPSVPILNP